MKQTYYEKEIEEKIAKFLNIRQIIARVGPRRSGKTTYLQNLKTKLPNSLYMSFEDQKVLDLFTQDIESFTKIYLSKVDYLIIDEFHYAKKGGKQLKYLFDFYPKLKIIISGSSAVDLTIKAIKYLVGRVVVFPLMPFSFREFLKAKDRNLFAYYQNLKIKSFFEVNKKGSAVLDRFNNLLEEYILFGGYPEVVLEKDREVKKTLLNQIYSLYFLKEVRDILGLIDDYKLKLLIKALSLQTGNICQFQELSRISGFSTPTLKKYLNFLEKTFISFFIKPYFTNKRTELSKNPKVYFFDLGFRNTVIDNFLSFDKRSDRGGLLENFVAGHFITKHSLNFWRSKSKAEVDFIVEKEGNLTPIEVKSTLFKSVLSQSLSSFIRKYRPKKAFLFSLNYFGKRRVGNTNVFFLPIFLSQIVIGSRI